jgi:hypothetical protein
MIAATIANDVRQRIACLFKVGCRKYLKDHNLPYLHKPFGLTEFQAAMDGILAGDRKKPGESSN